ncbi:DUF6311 domain-containing protein [Ruminococcaceae bacterium OttesenSCG-928-O06]|nr:DUF6311 domain-containing protein [Ruminococcaceae bacterium OttesenSCG-928-O06]
MKKRPFLSVRGQCVLGGALLGAAAFLLLYGFAPLAVTNDAWLRGGFVERDTLQHYAGWLLYRASPWQFPVAVAQHINYPAGGYIGFADSIPVFGVLFKLLSPVLPATFQYFGLWGLLCSCLQGAAAALLLCLFSQNRVRVLLLCLPFVFAPILLDRQLRHAALGAQWLVLFALYLYFKHRRSGTFFSPGFAVLCALSIGIHPYFTPMVFALLFALLVQNGIAQKKLWQPAAQLGICLGTTVLFGWVLGAFSSGSSAGSTPYGYFCMNLNALFNPRALDADWSLFLPQQNQTLGNYDGFNYLGLAALLSWVVMAADFLLHRKKYSLKTTLRRHGVLALVCLLLAVFAVSTTVTAQGRVLFSLPVPQWFLQLAGTFRSSGRLFYPVWYLLLLGAALYWLRRPTPPRRTLAVLAFVALQLLDTSPGIATKARLFRPYQPLAWAGYMQSGFWDEVAGKYDHLVSIGGGPLLDGGRMALYTADAGMTTSDPFTARYDAGAYTAGAAAALQQVTLGGYREDSLYITPNETLFLEAAYTAQQNGLALFCAQIDDNYYVLAPRTTAFDGYYVDGVVAYQDYPLMLARYTDALWDGGVLMAEPQTVCFVDTAFAREKLAGMAALQAEDGQAYAILDVSFRDAGWILVTLDIPDAAVLRGVPLQGVPAP